jgi:hypothetical protein
VRTLREFAAVVERAPAGGLDAHLRRGDFSRWIADVFGDYPLAKSIEALEDDYRRRPAAEVGAAIAEAVRARYDFVEPAAT